MKMDNALEEEFDAFGDDHIASSAETPLRNDAFELSDEEKIDRIQADVYNIMETLGLDLTDDSLKGTPKRVAKMFVKEIFGGLHPNKKPSAPHLITNINMERCWLKRTLLFTQLAEHHLLPIVGRAHIAYISKGKVVGLSKMNRIVDYFAKRPQVQERMTIQIVQELQKVLGTDDVACVVDAKHLCVNSRGIRDIESSTVTAEFGGQFKNPSVRREFLDYIKLDTQF